MKIGRNDPCSCGSGKKYKKCCLQIEAKQEKEMFLNKEKINYKASLDPLSGSRNIASDLKEIPYTRYRMLDNPDYINLANEEYKRNSRSWTPLKVAAISREDLIDKMRDIGVSIDHELCIEGETFGSAWKLGESWLKDLGKDVSDQDRCFVCLAACRLWKEKNECNPSLEMIEDWMQGGYEAAFIRRDLFECCDLWKKVWDVGRKLLSKGMKSIYEVDEFFGGAQSFGDWVGDYEMELLNAAHDDKKYALQGIDFMGEVENYLSSDFGLVPVQQQCSLAEFYCLAGEQAKGEEIIEAVLEANPKEAGVYVAKSETVSSHRKRNGLPPNYDLAREILSMGLERSDNAESFDLQARKESLPKATIDATTKT